MLSIYIEPDKSGHESPVNTCVNNRLPFSFLPLQMFYIPSEKINKISLDLFDKYLIE